MINGLTVPANAPDNPFGAAVRVSRVAWEQPAIWGQKVGSEANPSFNAGVKGEFGRNWRYDANISMSRSSFQNIDAISPFFPAAATTPGGDRLTPVLFADPANRLKIFGDGRTGPLTTQAVWNSLYFWDPTNEKSDSWTYSAQADGPVWTLPAGDISLVVGGEFNEKSVRFVHPGVSNNFRFDVRGTVKSNSNAFFAETAVPLVAEKHKIPLVNHLKLTVSGRRDEYDGFGAAKTSSAAVIYRPVSWITARARMSDSFKTPLLNQVKAPASALSFQGSPLALDTLRGNEPITWVVLVSQGGNPEVGPETGESRSFGIVLDLPKVLPGLKLSIDQMKNDIEDRISNPNLQQMIDFFPSKVLRDAATPADTAAGRPGRVNGYPALPVNISFLKMANRDYQLNYRRKTAIGEFNLTGRSTEWLKYETKVTPTAPVVDTTVTFPRRYNSSLYWTNRGWTMGVSHLYQRGYVRAVGFLSTYIPAANEWTVHMSRDFDQRAFANQRWLNQAFAKSNLALTIVNVFDREPPPTSGITAAGAQTFAGFAVTDARMIRYTLVFRRPF